MTDRERETMRACEISTRLELYEGELWSMDVEDLLGGTVLEEMVQTFIERLVQSREDEHNELTDEELGIEYNDEGDDT